MHKNKGFTLVELIVIMVIIVVLVGISVTGLFPYTHWARNNTDIYNASVIQDRLTELTANKAICKWASDINTDTEKDKKIELKWSEANKEWFKGKLETSKPTDDDTEKLMKYELYTKLKNYFPDGLPESKSGNQFIIYLESTGYKPAEGIEDTEGYKTAVAGTPKLTCKVYAKSGEQIYPIKGSEE